MLRHSLSALAGAWSLQLLERLPPDAVLLALGPAAVLLCTSRRLRLAASFLGGACLVGLAADRVLDDRLPRSLEGETVAVVGRVLGFPDARTVPLSWYAAPVVPRIGETWALTVRLRRPRGFANPLHFDYEHWLFRQGIGGTGYVIAGERVPDMPVQALPALRSRLAERIQAVLGRDPA